MGRIRLGHAFLFISCFDIFIKAQNVCHTESIISGYKKISSYSYYNNPSFQQIICRNIKSISELKNQNYGNVQAIHVSSSSLNVLKPEQLHHRSYNNVLKLELVQSNISQIIPGFFSPFTSLQYLNLAENNISVIIDGVFHQLISLERLDLSKNVIKELSGHALIGLPKLSMVNLSLNQLEEIPENVFQYQDYIRQLNLSHNHFTTFSISSNIGSVDLSYNKLQNISACNLFLIDLSFNELVNISNVQNVTIFNASHNSLSELEIHDTNMTTLDVSFNNLSKLDENSLSKANKIKWLHLQHNSLQSMPSNIFVNMSHLKSLDVSYNNLSLYQHGSDDNWLNILSSPALENVNLEKNCWSCKNLKEIIANLYFRKIKIYNSNVRYNTSNVLGMECLEENQQFNSNGDQTFDHQTPEEIFKQINNLNQNITNLSQEVDVKMISLKNAIIVNINSSLEEIINNKIKDLESKIYADVNKSLASVSSYNETTVINKTMQSLNHNVNKAIEQNINTILSSSFCRRLNLTECFKKLSESNLKNEKELELYNQKYNKKVIETNSKLEEISEKIARLQLNENNTLIHRSSSDYNNANQNIYIITNQIISYTLLTLILLVLLYIAYIFRKNKSFLANREQISLI